MTFGASGWISVVELIVFLPSLLIAILICSRHGFNRSSGWVYTLILCSFRIVGAICQLASIHDHSSGLLKATLIIDSIGLSPLLLATLGMLSRFIDWSNSRHQGMLSVKHFRILQLLISLGLILSIAGGSGGSDSNGTPKIATTTKVAIVLFIVAYVGICIVWLIGLSGLSFVPGREKLLCWGVLLALPMIVVRLLYAALAVFVHDHAFNLLDGSVGVHVAMTVIEEFGVVFVYLTLGFLLEPMKEQEQGPIATRPWKTKRSNDREIVAGAHHHHHHHPRRVSHH